MNFVKKSQISVEDIQKSLTYFRQKTKKLSQLKMKKIFFKLTKLL